ncbi:copper resistance protein CopC [Streptomyces sp. NPDC090083]|uniref:copper resistance CopC family protein n=1 Tax=Streptomyces sp. NPDC090083 TaxID=3365941 RepID=UPI0037FAC42E
MRGLRLLRAPAVLCAAVCALLSAGGTPAHAHTALQEASPAPGAKVGPDTQVIALTFGSLLPGTVPKVSAAGPDGEAVPVGEPVRVAGSTVCAAVRGLPTGVDSITYTVLAADGDAQTNRFLFQVAKDAKAAPVPAACRGRRLPSPPAQRASGLLEGQGPAVVGASVATAVLAAVVGALVIRRKRGVRTAVVGGRTDSEEG